MDPRTAKITAGVGSLLSLVGLNIVGYILIWLGLRALGGYYNDEAIRRGAFRWLVFAIMGTIATVAAIYAVAVAWSFHLMWLARSLPMDASSSNLFLNWVLPRVIPVFLISFSIVEAFSALSAVYLKRAYAALAVRTGEDLFNIAASLYWWGSLLIVMLVGFVLIWISWAVSAAVFFSASSRRPSVTT